MTAIYDNVRGVRVSRWMDDDLEEPSIETGDAKLEEMYVDNGYLYLGVILDDRGYYINVPILPRNNWNDLVESLPVWE